jgi:hypothetical protein
MQHGALEVKIEAVEGPSRSPRRERCYPYVFADLHASHRPILWAYIAYSGMTASCICRGNDAGSYDGCIAHTDSF